MPYRRTNRLLSLLSDDDYERLRPHLSHVVFDYKKSLYEASRPIDHVYFPIDGVASLVLTTAEGTSAESAPLATKDWWDCRFALGTAMRRHRFTSRCRGRLSEWTPAFSAANSNATRH